MKFIYKRRKLFIFLILLIFFLFLLWKSNRKIDGSNGGILKGPSHKNGGIKTRLKSTGEIIEVQGGEDILTSEVNKIKDRYVCEGTPGGIASSLNVIGGGVKFDNNGSCKLI